MIEKSPDKARAVFEKLLIGCVRGETMIEVKRPEAPVVAVVGCWQERSPAWG